MKILKSIILINCLLLMACGSETNSSVATKKTETSTSKETAAPVKEKRKNIIFFGDSLSAGYGLDPLESFPALIQNKIDSEKLNYKIVNAGLSGDTSAGGAGRVDWVLRQPVDVFVLELGGNDMLRGIPTEETYKNMTTILQKVKAKYPDAKLLIAGMEAPPNLGKEYVKNFRAIFSNIAKEHGAVLIPFLLDKVGGVEELNQPDKIHPTAKGHQIVAETVWTYLKDLL